MRVLVTGADGFIGRNLVSHLELRENTSVMTYTRDNSPLDLLGLVSDADFIFHLAGVNRPANEDEFKEVNEGLTKQLISAIRDNHKHTPLLITSSTQAELDNPYGKSKLAAEKTVVEWHRQSASPVYIYRLPGVFGKWCKPNYNSVVATFCHNIANNLPIRVSDPDQIVSLAYIDDVIVNFVRHIDENSYEKKDFQYLDRVFEISLGDLRNRIYAIHNIRQSLVIPDLSEPLNKFLYATYTSYLPEDSFSYVLLKNRDDRGWLTEFVKSHQFGQIFISRTKPGITRGNHWHKTKIEKFLVIAGHAEVTFRNKGDYNDVIAYRVRGNEMRILDIPVGYVHAIKNIGNNELITIFWASEILNKDDPDTFYEKVTGSE